MSLEKIKELIEGNKDNEDVKAYLEGLNPVDVSRVQKFVEENEDAKKWIDSEKDKHYNKAFSTWKTNNWEKELDVEIKKRFPEKDQKDIELEKIKAQLAQMESEKTRESLTNKAIKIANQKKIPLDLIDFVVSDSEDSTIKNIEKLETIINGHIQSQIEERLKSNSTYTPPKGGDGKVLTLEQIKNMSPEEINKNWDSVQKVLQGK